MDCNKCQIEDEYIEEGWLRKAVVKFCPLHAVAEEMLGALKSILGLIEDNNLVRNISKDDDRSYYFRQGLRITRTLAATQEAIARAEGK